MTFTKTKLPGVWLITTQIFKDGRGLFFEEYNKRIFAKEGIRVDFVQDNRSLSHKGTIRGLHYQLAPMGQAKLVHVLRGRAFDVIVDLRKESKTFGQYVSHILDDKKKQMIYIPEGFAHGFLALEKDTEFVYKVSNFYSPKYQRGLAWNDPQIKIAWPKINTPYLLSQKDKSHPFLNTV